MAYRNGLRQRPTNLSGFEECHTLVRELKSKFSTTGAVMPQNTKDSKGGKSHPTQDSGANAGKSSGDGKAEKKSGSPVGSQNKGEKKTTP